MSQEIKTVAMIIARLTSNRLPRKQLRLINEIPLMQHIIERLGPISSIDQIVLATGPNSENQDLADFVAGFNVDTYFDDDVDDVTGRIARAANYYEADIVVTVSGDCPMVDANFLAEGIQILKKSNADYVYVDKEKNACLHEGLGFHTNKTWQRLDQLSTTWSHREHAGSVIYENSNLFQGAEIIPLPEFRRTDIRISVDTQADLDFMNKLYAISGSIGSTLNLADVVKLIDNNKQLLNINEHVHQKRSDEKSQHYLIVTYASSTLGMGHLSRSLVLARQLKEGHSARVTFLTNDDEICQKRVEDANCNFVSWEDATELMNQIERFTQEGVIDGIVIDLKQPDLQSDFIFLASLNLSLTIIDVWPNSYFQKALTIIPTLSTQTNETHSRFGRVLAGPEYVLLDRNIRQSRGSYSPNTKTILITAGGSGNFHNDLMGLLAELATNCLIRFIVGPYAQMNILEKQIKHYGLTQTEILQDPPNLYQIFAQSTLAFSIYGVISLELIALGIPQCIYHTLSIGDAEIVENLMLSGICMDLQQLSAPSSTIEVQTLLNNSAELKLMSNKSRGLIDGHGAARVASLVTNQTLINKDLVDA